VRATSILLPTRKRKLRIALLLAMITAAGAASLAVWMNHRPHVSEVFTTQRPGEPKIVWHTMETRWQRGIFQQGDQLQVSDIKSDADSLYTISGEIISRIDKSSGSVDWKQNLARPGQTIDGSWRWSTTITPAYVVAEKIGSGSPQQREARLCAIRVSDGKPAWEVVLDTPIASEPAVSGSRLLIPLMSGEVMCVSIGSGLQLWRRQISSTHYSTEKQNSSPVLELGADPGICIARAGARHFMAVDPYTGEQLWSKTISGAIRRAERVDLDDVPFTLNRGVLYLSPTNAKVIAWNPATGYQEWRHVFDLPHGTEVGAASDPPIVTRDFVLADCGDHWSALHRADGTSAWDQVQFAVPGHPYSAQNFNIDAANDACDTFYVTDMADPVIHRTQRVCRSASVYNVVAIDLVTGKERWRWQDDVMDYLQNLVPDGSMLYCNSNDRVVALGPGPGESLPPLNDGRMQLAYRMIEDLTQWNPRGESVFARMWRRLSMFARPNRNQLGPSRTHAQICLLNLGSDSIAPLMELISHQIAEIDSKSPPVGRLAWSRAWQLTEPLEILYDIRAYSAVPALVKHLQSASAPEARQKIAELLIRLNDVHAAPALYTYAKSCTDQESVGGEETLAYLTTFAPSARSAGVKAVTQVDITRYLVASLADLHAPAWVRRFGQFELMRGRGEDAYRLAVSRIQHNARASLMPTMTNIATGGYFLPWFARTGSQFAPSTKTRDLTGRWWGVFEYYYFGQPDVWVAQSKDGKKWERPTVGISNLDPDSGLSVAFQWHGSMDRSGLKFSWKDDGNHKHTRIVSIHDLYKDSDSDGIPDIVEREIGTNPMSKDSHRTGLSDGDNKNPTYTPHRLSRDEQIYQAVIEAACMYSHDSPAGIPINTNWAGPVDLASPLIVPAGPEGMAVPIYSHTLPVLMYSPADLKKLHRSSWGNLGFARAVIGFDGKLDPRHTMDYEDVQNSYPEHKSRHSRDWFKKWFPYQESPDHTRVRVGVYGEGIGFDVEVDNIGDKWLPVECRRTLQSSHHSRWEAAAPVREE